MVEHPQFLFSHARPESQSDAFMVFACPSFNLLEPCAGNHERVTFALSHCVVVAKESDLLLRLL